MTDGIFVNENVKFVTQIISYAFVQKIFFSYVCLEGLDLRTIVQLLHVTTMLSVVLTLIGRRVCYKWNFFINI